MIQSGTKGRLTCDEPKCKQSSQVNLVLLNNGCWAVDKDSLPTGWQIGWDKEKVAPYKSMCPMHKADAPRVVTVLGSNGLPQ